MTTAVQGVRDWGPLNVDEQGYREYRAAYLIRGGYQDGPYTVWRTPGTPIPGSIWDIGSDIDPWVWCLPRRTISRLGVTEGTAVAAADEIVWWLMEVYFSNKPLDVYSRRCNDNEIENPLLEPYKYSGGGSNEQVEAHFDMFGIPLVNSAWEQLRGDQVKFDENHPFVRIRQNVADLQLALISAFANCVNDRPMWGLPARTIKLRPVPWDEVFYGTCYRYFTRDLEFDINFDTWDRVILDEGTMVLNGKWHPTTRHYEIKPIAGEAPDRFNPAHFIRAEDFHGNPARILLNGYGVPAGVCIDGYVPESFDDSFEIYISLVGPVPTANIGKSLHNREYWMRWVPATGETAFAIPPNEWTSEITYKRGNIVWFNTNIANDYYICLSYNTNQPPVSGASTTLWKWLGFGLTNKGIYSPTVTYGVGDYVTEYNTATAGTGTGTGTPCNTTEIGRITVMKYPNANFLLLGVPLILPF